MHFLTLLTISTLLPLLSSAVLTLSKRTDPRVIKFPISTRSLLLSDDHHERHKRQFTNTTTVANTTRVFLNNDRYYTHDVNLTLGNPPQHIRALIDTGSALLMVHTPSSDLCKPYKYFCGHAGTYVANDSSTYHYLNSGFKAGYWSGEIAIGDFATDALSIAGVDITGAQFGIMYKTNVTDNVLGLAYTTAKDIVTPLEGNIPHENLPTLLVKQKIIESRAFSLWLHDLNTPGGELLFGGVDTGKCEGKLVTVPFVERVRDTVIDFSILLHDVKVTDSKGKSTIIVSKSTPLFALMDSGSAATVLPDDIVDAVYEKLGANLTTKALPLVNCSLINDPTTIDFVFDNELTIKVPLSQLVFPLKGVSQCPLWGLLKTSHVPYNTIILGTSFLSSAYVVFDLDNKEASIAQANQKPTTSNILQITSGPHSVPGGSETWTGVPIPGETIDDWRYLGCAKETVPRTLSSISLVAQNLTIEICQNFCRAHNYRLAGLQYADECYCGEVLTNGGAVGARGCNMPCKGKSDEICGGRSRVSIFQDQKHVPVKNPPIVKGFGYIGCFEERSKGRLLKGASLVDQADMTAKKCMGFCQQNSVANVWAGLQYGKECFCSKTLPATVVPAPEDACDMICSGDKKEWCGGSSRISNWGSVTSSSGSVDTL